MGWKVDGQEHHMGMWWDIDGQEHHMGWEVECQQ